MRTTTLALVSVIGMNKADSNSWQNLNRLPHTGSGYALISATRMHNIPMNTDSPIMASVIETSKVRVYLPRRVARWLDRAAFLALHAASAGRQILHLSQRLSFSQGEACD